VLCELDSCLYGWPLSSDQFTCFNQVAAKYILLLPDFQIIAIFVRHFSAQGNSNHCKNDLLATNNSWGKNGPNP
jgi:hypothetical protein